MLFRRRYAMVGSYERWAGGPGHLDVARGKGRGPRVRWGGKGARQMVQRMVKCVKLSEEAPGIDEATTEGEAAMVMVRSFGDEVLAKKIYENVSQEAWKMWVGHMTMVINEYRLDPASPE